MNLRSWPKYFPIFALPAALAGSAAEVPLTLGLPAAETDIRRDATVAAVQSVMPSVVNVGTATMVRQRDSFEDFFSEFFAPYHGRRGAIGYSLGSGVIIDEEGYVLTNDHVVRRADKVWIRPSGSTNNYEAEVVATDSKADVALLKIQAKAGEKFPAIRFAPDDDLLLGETVLSLGNPFGLGLSVSRGILSSKSRVPPKESEQFDIPNWLQTDASINPGSSGGPLVNLKGEMIGLNVAILANAQGIGFAIPAKRVAEALSGMVAPTVPDERLWFGARVKAGGGPLAVLSVQSESPAAKAGLKSGDLILQVNGQSPKGFIHFNELLASGGKREVALTVTRDGERRSLSLRLVAETTFFNAEMIEKKTGLKLQALNPGRARAMNMGPGTGLEISAVDRSSAAAGGLQPGYLITAIDGQPAFDLTEAAKIVYAKKAGEKLRLDIAVYQQRGPWVSLQQRAVELSVR